MNDYLDELRNKLSGFDMTERDEILEEIESHIEAGLEDGRFQSNLSRLIHEMGTPTEMVQRLSSGKKQYGWGIILLLLIPFLFVDEAPYFFSLLEFRNGGLPGDATLSWSILTGLIVLIVVGEFLLSWRKRSLVIALWWSSFVVAYFVQPFFAAWLYGWPFNEFVSVGSMLVVGLALLPFIWLLWRARFDSLLMVFGTLPLTLGILTNTLWMEQINMAINFRLTGIGIVVEPLLRLFMWSGVIASYFLPLKRRVRWFGLSGVIFFYLFGTAVFISTLNHRWLAFSPIMMIWVFAATLLMVGVGMALDKQLSWRRRVS